MDSLVLHTYRTGRECREEALRLESEGYTYVPFDVTGGARTAFSEGGRIYSDLSNVVALLPANQHLMLNVEETLSRADGDVFLLIRDSFVQSALDIFPLLFEAALPLVAEEKGCRFVPGRCPLYTFSNRAEYDRLVRLASDDSGYQVFTLQGLSQRTSEFSAALENSEIEVFIDLTSEAALADARLLTIEPLASVPNAPHFLVSEARSAKVFESFPSLFDEIRDVTDLLPECSEEMTTGMEGPRSVCDLNDGEFAGAMAEFDERLTGHANFKYYLHERLTAFRLAHALGDQRIFSIFLFGESGIGKTETARLLSELVSGGERYLVKINFEAYSSQDSLNSLIGSPSGYVGCEGGELNDKVEKAKAKVLLCDEFEKTKQDVRSFFLELLEDGAYTDRMGVEHDMDGYVVVFTSNVKDEKELRERIAPELLTRFDLICEFVSPTVEEKRGHVVRLAREKVAQYAGRLGVDAESVGETVTIADSQLEKWSLREIDREVVRQVVSLLPIENSSELSPYDKTAPNTDWSE